MTRNEAAVQAMLDTLEAYAGGHLGWDGFQKVIAEAFAAERRATVERIRHPILNAVGHSKVGADRVRAVLDEEAAR